MLMNVSMIKVMLPGQVKQMSTKEYTELRNFVIRLIKEEDSRRK
jgi:hypothetical protein